MRPRSLAPSLAAVAMVALAALAVAGCSALPFLGTPAPPARAQPLPPAANADPFKEALAAFTALGIDDYTWQVDVACECGMSGRSNITVVDGTATKVTTPRGERPVADVAEFPLTVGALLREAIDASAKGAAVGATWPGNDGIPSEVHIDRDPRAIDDELDLTVVSFVPAP